MNHFESHLMEGSTIGYNSQVDGHRCVQHGIKGHCNSGWFAVKMKLSLLSNRKREVYMVERRSTAGEAKKKGRRSLHSPGMEVGACRFCSIHPSIH